MPARKPILALECILLFVVVPGLLIVWQLNGGVEFFPMLMGMLTITLLLGILDPSVRLREHGSWAHGRAALPRIFLRFLLVSLSLALLTRWRWPDLFLRFPRENTRIWLAVMVLYPLLSVVPQEFFFRTFFMQRYRPLFGDGLTMLLVNALIFGWAHAFFLNPIAPILSVVGGYLLAETWQRTHSLRAACLEHALYGCTIFTIGLGWFFYHGSTETVQHLLE